VYIHTLGCPKNDADSRAVARVLQEAGARVVAEPENATHLLINTCGFIEAAKEESIEAILSACAGYPHKRVVVMGCLVERYRTELAKEIPEVGEWLGVAGESAYGELARLVQREAYAGRTAGEVDGSLPLARAYAYLKISDGCDEPCTFCAIPGIKGAYRSVGFEGILREADLCLEAGARELVLVGQDTSRWADGPLALTDLVDALTADARVRRIRIMYLQPDGVDDRLLEYMASQPKLCRYLDVPFQHSHPDVLRAMGRSGDGSTYLALLERARRLMPDVSVRSTFITGFPGEKQVHFDHLIRFVESAGFDYAGGFVYSPEEGTPAAALRPRVSRGVAARRLARLDSILAESAERLHQRLVGMSLEVMIDDVDAEDAGEEPMAVGRTAGQAPEVDGVTYVEGALPPGTRAGDVLRVKVTAAVGYDLVGEWEDAS
jgi:ribosomal protein S12 methylthiotransferase